jgi:hypothetical protein
MRNRAIALCVVLFSSAWLASAPTLGAQAPTFPAATSAAKAKELAALMQSKKMEAFAAKVPEQPARYAAVLLSPGVQMTLVSSIYERFSDIDYRIYYKDFMNAFMDLRTGMLAKERVIIEDHKCDGLLPVPGKESAPDIVSGGGSPRSFDGDFADPKKRAAKPPKISPEEYLKLYTDNDANYAKLLDVLLTELKKIQ